MRDQQPLHVDVEVYLLVEPKWKSSYYKDEQGRPILDSASVVKHTKARPTVQRSGVATKLTLRFPAGSFLPLQPEAIIEIQQGDIQVITVVASDPGLDEVVDE